MKFNVLCVGHVAGVAGVAEWLEQSTAIPSMRVHAPLGADFSAHCEIKQSLNHFAFSQVTGTLKKGI